MDHIQVPIEEGRDASSDGYVFYGADSSASNATTAKDDTVPFDTSEIEVEYGVAEGLRRNLKHKSDNKGAVAPPQSVGIRYNWEFPGNTNCTKSLILLGWGSVSFLDVDDEAEITEPKKHLLDQWRATAIAGNDLIGSVLYTIGVCTSVAGPYAPISLLLVCALLWPYRWIYSGTLPFFRTFLF